MSFLLKELKSIGDELDLRGLGREADIVDGVAKKIAAESLGEYEDEAPEVLEQVRGFINNHLNPDTSIDPATDEKVADMLLNDSSELRDYIIEFLPDAIYSKALELNLPSKDFYVHLSDEMRFDERYKEDSDFKFLADAFIFYLKDYEF